MEGRGSSPHFNKQWLSVGLVQEIPPPQIVPSVRQCVAEAIWVSVLQALRMPWANNFELRWKF